MTFYPKDLLSYVPIPKYIRVLCDTRDSHACVAYGTSLLSSSVWHNVTSHLRRLVLQIGLYIQCNIHCISCNMSNKYKNHRYNHNTLHTCITANLLHNLTHHRQDQATTYPRKITTRCPKVTFTLLLYMQPAQLFHKSTWNLGRIPDLVWISCIFATKY